MKHYISTLTLLLCVTFSVYSQPVHIPDPNLRAAVRETLNLSKGQPITPGAMLQLTGLDVTDRGIENLSGLEFATNLTWLSLAYNPVTDLRPIAGLTKLDTLYMWATPVSDISALSNLTNLRNFHANYSRIADMTPLANLLKLEELSLEGNAITDVTPLANLTQLRLLNLNHNDIVDVRPLAGLTSLTVLYVANNLITDHSPLDGLALTDFTYDQTCDMPPLPLQERLENRNFPSLFSPWGFLPQNQRHLSDPEQMSQHDMYFCCMSMFHMELAKTSDGYLVRGDLEKSIQRRDEYLAHNPNMIFLTTLNAVLEGFETFPEDSPYWLRDDAGNILEAFGAGLVKLNHPDVQKRIVDQVVAISKCGLYDGIHFDLWSEGHNAGRGQLSGQVAILKAIRERVRDNFLILVNTNVYKAPASAPYVNGSFFESGLPGDAPSEGDWSVSNQLKDMADTISWAEQNFRSPQINALLGFGLGREPMDSPTNRRYMRAVTTLNLTFSDGYFMYYLPGPGRRCRYGVVFRFLLVRFLGHGSRTTDWKEITPLRRSTWPLYPRIYKRLGGV